MCGPNNGRHYTGTSLLTQFIATVRMMTSSNGDIFRVTGPLWGESTGHRWIPLKRPAWVTRSLDVFFDLRLNERLGKPSRLRWFETPSRLLLRHCNAVLIHRSFTGKHPDISWNSPCCRWRESGTRSRSYQRTCCSFSWTTSHCRTHLNMQIVPSLSRSFENMKSWLVQRQTSSIWAW